MYCTAQEALSDCFSSATAKHPVPRLCAVIVSDMSKPWAVQ